MAEGRVRKYGRNLARLINYVIDTIPEEQRKRYRDSFLEELENYEFTPRRKGEPRNKGCINELEEIDNVEIENPEHLARLIKEGIHLMYAKPTAKRLLDALKDNLLK